MFIVGGSSLRSHVLNSDEEDENEGVGRRRPGGGSSDGGESDGADYNPLGHYLSTDGHSTGLEYGSVYESQTYDEADASGDEDEDESCGQRSQGRQASQTQAAIVLRGAAWQRGLQQQRISSGGDVMGALGGPRRGNQGEGRFGSSSVEAPAVSGEVPSQGWMKPPESGGQKQL